MFNLKKTIVLRSLILKTVFFKIRLEFKFQGHSYREVSIQEQTRILISRTSWKFFFFSREQSGSFYFKNRLEFYFMHILSTCSRTDRIYFKRSLEGFISRTIGSLIS